MSLNNLKKARLTSLAGGVMAGIASAAERKAVDELITRIKDKSDKVRTEAWLSAGEAGAPAVKPLAKVMTDEDLEVARAAKRGLWNRRAPTRPIGVRCDTGAQKKLCPNSQDIGLRESVDSYI